MVKFGWCAFENPSLSKYHWMIRNSEAKTLQFCDIDLGVNDSHTSAHALEVARHNVTSIVHYQFCVLYV